MKYSLSALLSEIFPGILQAQTSQEEKGHRVQLGARVCNFKFALEVLCSDEILLQCGRKVVIDESDSWNCGSTCVSDDPQPNSGGCCSEENISGQRHQVRQLSTLSSGNDRLIRDERAENGKPKKLVWNVNSNLNCECSDISGTDEYSKSVHTTLRKLP